MALVIVILILIGLYSRERSKKNAIKKTEQQRQAALQRERQVEIDKQNQEIERQNQITIERRAALRRKNDEARQRAEVKRQEWLNSPEYQLQLSVSQNAANGLRPVDSITEGDVIDFVYSDIHESIIINNLNGESITYTYINSKNGYRLMLPTEYELQDCREGQIFKCICLRTSKEDGRPRKWLTLANNEEIERQMHIERQNQIERDKQVALQRRQAQAEAQRRQEEQYRQAKQRQLAEQKRQAAERENISSLSESAEYIGEYKNKKIHGKGTLIYSDGTKYEGDFVDGKKEGYGILSSSDGGVYEGNFKKDKFNGNGVLTKANGDIIEGEFADGNFVSDKVGEEIINYLGSHRDLWPFYLFIDTETTGLLDDNRFEEHYYDHFHIDEDSKLSKLLNAPRLVRLSYIIHDKYGNEIASNDFIIRPTEFTIPISASNIHGITTERAKREGRPLKSVLRHFRNLYDYAYVIGHNIYFDQQVISTEFLRNNIQATFSEKNKIDIMGASTDFCAIKGKYGNRYPKLSELHYKLFQTDFDGAHDSSIDVAITAKCFWELRRLNIL